ncbi:hypothetical protein BO70DRAFT_24965 [Aspergillus heteromorphus CBS 117.55]|uniref:Xylanolytic transcriptional activator regulatory domain-containing protein n=1 Tax=Aspergillus heteromorphus CBS 117.55 TaxID=1448321 RepID=A0A317WBT0_9EURO|nr:uncharacterized protein BO70DRAFT_24965 [Aspergillus heteromorphus CBS 117.55]PWY83405.1 hypothetical protein BO70DRAFT_24965 [Aspergillus heteromorphus CBS 117.55]
MVDRIDGKLDLILSIVSRRRVERETIEAQTDLHEDQHTIVRAWSPPKDQPLDQAAVVPFSGETSIRHNLDQVEGRLEEKMQEHPGAASRVPQSQISTPALTPSPRPEGGRKTRGAVEITDTLQRYGITLDRPQAERALNVFCNEIHIMYPFMHLPTLWGDYSSIWGGSFGLPPDSDVSGQSRYRNTLAQILLCMAVGRCTESAREEHREGRYSAGWSLYRAASDLLGDVLDCFGNHSDPIQILQTLNLMIIYLFRLDLSGKAEKLLALAISHAHQIGLHRSKVVERMAPYDSEVSRRIWWCLYVMDRRLAIETGRPFVIQDINVDTPLPENVDDEWLSRSRKDPRLKKSVPPQGETKDAPTTAIPYLRAMVIYSKVLGKVWEGMYGAASSSSSNYTLREHLESMLSRAQTDVQHEFAHPYHGQRRQMAQTPWWLAKLQMLMRIRWLSLRLMIRKPMLQASFSQSASALDTFDNDVTCMQISKGIIEEFAQISPEMAVYTFPFIHYLISAVIISLGLIVRESSLRSTYGRPIIYAVRLLESYCHKTWVSGKLIRIVSRLKEMTAYLTNDNASMGSEPSVPRPSSQVPMDSDNDRAREIHRIRSNYPSMPASNLPPTAGIPGPQMKENQSGVDHPTSIYMGRPGHSTGYTPTTAPEYFAPSAGTAHALPYPSVTNLTTLDFDFEADVTPTVGFTGLPFQGSSMMQPPPNQATTLPGATQNIMPEAIATSGPQAQQFAVADSGAGGVGGMEWLETLFGNYLDPNFIIRQSQ